MEFNQDSENENTEDVSLQNKAKQWFQDNMRVIISVLIVVLIAGGIYSYSNRTETPETKQEVAISIDQENEATEEDEEGEITSDAASSEEKSDDSQKSEDKPTEEKEKTSSISTSQETDESFVEVASSGDSKTKLARKALANFLEKNSDPSLTAEHKIYIEDYLRKNIDHQGGVSVGTSLEFSKNLIREAISKSKDLNENQLKNLEKYSARVPSLA